MGNSLLAFAPKRGINTNKLGEWLKKDLNVLLVGSHGVGKTSMILETFRTHFGTNWAFFNGATTDPWTELIGIPTVNHENGKEALRYIKPEELHDGIEGIYVDELNRAKMATRNALLELIQFKSINGRKFPNLKVVWASVNPPKEDDNDEDFAYDVEELDPAQVDRFHIILRLPEEPDLHYFSSKYGNIGKNLINWWKSQSATAKKLISPRRLEYVAQLYRAGFDIADALPQCANVKDLKSCISSDPTEEKLKAVLKSGKKGNISAFFKNPNHLDVAIAYIEGSENWGLLDELNAPDLQQYLERQADTIFAKYEASPTKFSRAVKTQLAGILAKTSHEKAAKIKEEIKAVIKNRPKKFKYLGQCSTSSEFEQAFKNASSQLNSMTYYRRKAVTQLAKSWPANLPKESLSDLEDFCNKWATKVQGLSFRYALKGSGNTYQEVMIIEEIFRNFILPYRPKAIHGLCGEKFLKNGFTFKELENVPGIVLPQPQPLPGTKATVFEEVDDFQDQGPEINDLPF